MTEHTNATEEELTTEQRLERLEDTATVTLQGTLVALDPENVQSIVDLALFTTQLKAKWGSQWVGINIPGDEEKP